MTTETGEHPGDQHHIPTFEQPGSATEIKAKIKQHYDVASDHYFSLWGEHIHHAYKTSPTDTKEQAQQNLIRLLLDLSNLAPGSTVLDVGCGVGGTSLYLAEHHKCHVTGITLSTRQVELAQKLSRESGIASGPVSGDRVQQGGTVQFEELDAEYIADRFDEATFDAVWVSEALSHFTNKTAFFRDVHTILKAGGKLVIADWFKAPNLTDEQMETDILPIMDGMLLPSLCTMREYIHMANLARLNLLPGDSAESQAVKDISKEVAETWDVSWKLVHSPALWKLAISHGRDGLAFLQTFRAIRRGYANGTLLYAAMAFLKRE